MDNQMVGGRLIRCSSRYEEPRTRERLCRLRGMCLLDVNKTEAEH